MSEVVKFPKYSAILIGVGPANYSSKLHPGWSANSVGYHGDDGA